MKVFLAHVRACVFERNPGKITFGKISVLTPLLKTAFYRRSPFTASSLLSFVLRPVYKRPNGKQIVPELYYDYFGGITVFQI